MRLVPWAVQAAIQGFNKEARGIPTIAEALKYMRSRRIPMKCTINTPGEGSGGMNRGYKDLKEGLDGVENQLSFVEGDSATAANLKVRGNSW